MGKKDGKGKKVSKIGKEKRERTKVAYIRTLAKFGISKSSAELNYINFYE